MQRLILPEPRSDRGASAVIVAVSMVALLGFAALSIDVGALWSDKKELQNGADAAALAVAQKCANDGCDFDYDTMADDYAAENKSDANARATSVEINETAGTVLVTTTSTRNLWFAPVLSIDTADVGAVAEATWIKNPDGLTTLPLTVSQCQFNWQNGVLSGDPLPGQSVLIKLMTNHELQLIPDSVAAELPCIDNPAHNEVAGGFGWLNPDPGTCTATITADHIVGGDPGVSVPSCPAGLTLTYGEVIKVPVFDGVGQVGDKVIGGAKAEYHIAGFAALKLYGWNLNGNLADNEFNKWPGATPNQTAQNPGIYTFNGGDTHIWGEFVKYGTLEEWGTSGGSTDFGISIIKLSR